MKKPHEQEWKVEQESPSHQPYVTGPDGRVATIQVRYKTTGKYATPQMTTARAEADVIAAAPDMARALLLALENDHTGHDAPREVIEAALRKAGVL